MKQIKITFTIIVPYVVIFLLLSGCSPYKIRRRTAFSRIALLKESALLVRLDTYDERMKYLEKKGKFDQIKQEKAELEDNNKKIIAVFNKYFDFCDVYFFYASDGRNLKSGNFNKVKLMDSEKNEIENKDFLKNGFLVAGFQNTYQDNFVAVDSNGNKTSVGGSSSLPALVISDEYFVQLEKPFPYSVVLPKFRKNKIYTIKELNKNLHNFFLKYQKKTLNGKYH